MKKAPHEEALLRVLVTGRRDLLRAARPFAVSEADAEDAVQAACERALLRAGSIRHDGNLLAWLRTLVRHVAVDLARRRKPHLPLDGTPLPQPVHTPLESWRWLAESDVHEALADCPAPLRETYALHFFEGLSHGEIAARLGVPVATVGTRVHRARARLRITLERRLQDAQSLEGESFAA